MSDLTFTFISGDEDGLDSIIIITWIDSSQPDQTHQWIIGQLDLIKQVDLDRLELSHRLDLDSSRSIDWYGSMIRFITVTNTSRSEFSLVKTPERMTSLFEGLIRWKNLYLKEKLQTKPSFNLSTLPPNALTYYQVLQGVY